MHRRLIPQTGCDDGQSEGQTDVAGHRFPERFEQFLVGQGHATADDHDRGVDGHHHRRDSPGQLVDELAQLLPGVRILLAGEREHLLGGVTVAPSNLPGAFIEPAERDPSDVPSHIVRPPSWMASQDHSRGDPGSHGQVQDIVETPTGAHVVFGDGGQPDPVVHDDGATEPCSQLSHHVDPRPGRKDHGGDHIAEPVDDAGQRNPDRP